MTIFREQALSSIRRGGDLIIDPADLAYFQGRLRNNIFDLIARRFREQHDATGLTKAILARRLGRRPEVITRYLNAPSNMTIETISDLLFGICGEELDPLSSAVDAKVEITNDLESSNVLRLSSRADDKPNSLKPQPSGWPNSNDNARSELGSRKLNGTRESPAIAWQ